MIARVLKMIKINSKVQIILILGLVLVNTADAENDIDFRENRITLIPDDSEYVRYVNEGHLVSCLGEDDNKNMKWLKPSGAEVDYRGRVHVEKIDGQLRLIFDSIIKEDQGKWTCVLDNEENDEKFFMMNVYVPISFDAVESVVSIREHQDVTIPCEVTGYPEPTIHWYFNGLSLMEKLVTQETKYKKLADGLFIRTANRTDSGEYTCKAFQLTEIMTNVEEQTVRLNILYKPTIWGHQRKTKYAFLNGDVNLTCEADGKPKPEFVWYRDGRKVSNIIFTEENYSVLQIFVKTTDDLGEYKCRVKNELGHAEHFINLLEGTKPEVPKVFYLRGLSSDTFDVDVGAKVDLKNRHKMDITGYRFELIPKDVFKKNNGSWSKSWVKDFPIADGVTYLLGPLSENTTYLARVASRNIAGFSDWYEVTEFVTLSKQPFITSGSQRIKFTFVLPTSVALYSIMKLIN